MNGSAQDAPGPAVLPFRDPTRPISARVDDLVSRLTLAEKIGQLCNQAAAIPRLGIPAYDYWSEGLHGVARSGRATVFPQAIGMAATWDPQLIQQVASAVGDEARARHHAAVRRNGASGAYQGLTLWSPNINIFRDPRWGRGQETWGEDPYLTGEMGAAYVRGLQGDHPQYLKTAACAKHYAVHSGPEKDRHTFDARPSLQDLHATYLPAFKKLVTEAKVEAVMGAYNRVYGEPACASPLLLEEILRLQWGFAGHVVSDCGAINDFHESHRVTADAAESAALAVKRGCDMSCVCTYVHLEEAVERGLVTEAEIDRALKRTLATRFKLGLFDPPGEAPYAEIPLSVIGSLEHRRLAYETALRSAVLLRNRDGVLPVRPDIRSLLVVGPSAASVDVLLGNYYGLNSRLTTLLEGIIDRVPEGVQVEYRPGCLLAQPNLNPLDWTTGVAADSDLTIACMGLSPLLENEEGDALLSADQGDRSDSGLPRVQVEFIKKLAANGAKIVLVLTGGSPVALGELEELVEAVLFVWYPGQEGGRAAADLLFGVESPSGKLPITFPRSADQLPPFADYSMAGRTYRYAGWEPLYPFGFGLSYSRFTYTQLELPEAPLSPLDSLPLRFTLTNAGPVEAEEVAQLYLSSLSAPSPKPLSSLIGFWRVRLKPGESREIEFTITPEMMAWIDEAGQPRLEPGEFIITVGGCSPGPRGQVLGAPEPLQATFTIAPSPRGRGLG